MIRCSHRLQPGATVIVTVVLLKKEKNYKKKTENETVTIVWSFASNIA